MCMYTCVSWKISEFKIKIELNLPLQKFPFCCKYWRIDKFGMLKKITHLSENGNFAIKTTPISKKEG